MTRFDHIAIGCSTLDAGSAYIKARLGVDVPNGGAHSNMATHNRLMATGPDTFFEIISIDSDAPAPIHNRWFGLDGFSDSPRPVAWVLNSNDLERDLAAARAAGVDLGAPTEQTRGNMSWRFAVRPDGKIPLDGIAPMLMQWPEMPSHPAENMADLGVRIKSIVIKTPHAELLGGLLSALSLSAMPLVIKPASVTRLEFNLTKPDGVQVIL